MAAVVRHFEAFSAIGSPWNSDQEMAKNSAIIGGSDSAFPLVNDNNRVIDGYGHLGTAASWGAAH